MKACNVADLGPGDMSRGNMGGNEYAPHPVTGVAVVVPTAPAMPIENCCKAHD